MSSKRYSYYFPPYNRDVLDADLSVVAEHGFYRRPNHFVNVDVAKATTGEILTVISVNLPSGHSVSPDALPVIKLQDGTEFKFEKTEDGSFTSITLNPGEVSELELSLGDQTFGSIVIDDTPPESGVAVRFKFVIGTPTHK